MAAKSDSPDYDLSDHDVLIYSLDQVNLIGQGLMYHGGTLLTTIEVTAKLQVTIGFIYLKFLYNVEECLEQL